jgi:serine-type D-Ala-D-Ala carboxypeptidase (penicillin-binding protein 5/6)
MKKIIIWFLILIFMPIQYKVSAAQVPSINAQAAVLIDINSGKVLYEKNANQKYGPASTTKVMTALITLEKAKLDEKVIVGPKPPYEDGSKIYVIEGEELTVEQLLYATLLESANDAALVLAEYIGGSKEGFAQMMNDRAKELGCTDTNFVNPNGLWDDNHYTTANDLALISKEAMKNEKFRDIVSTKSYKIPPTNKQPQLRYINNHNKLLVTTRYGYQGADGVKTGYTIKSKHTYVGSATRGDMHLVAAFLNSNKSLYDDTKILFDYGFNNFSSQKVLSKDESVSDITITGTDIKIPVYPENDYYITLPKDEISEVDKNITLNQSFSELAKGELVGFAEILVGDNPESKVSLLSGQEYKSPVYNIKSDKNGNYKKVISTDTIIMPMALVFGLFITRGIYRKIKRRSRR